MASNPAIFVGVNISSGRKPVTIAALDQELKILVLENWSIAETLSGLKEYPNFLLAVNSPERRSKANNLQEFKNKITHAGIKSLSKKEAQQWMETDAQKSYLVLCEHELFTRRTLEGRIQRALILYDEGLQINDPMDFFEEITRHKLLQGVLPNEALYSAKELDTLVAAFVAWMTVQRPHLVSITANFVLPVRE